MAQHRAVFLQGAALFISTIFPGKTGALSQQPHSWGLHGEIMPRSNILAPNQYDPNFSVPNNFSTLKVDPTMTGNVAISVSGIRCVNVIGAGPIKIQSSSLTLNQQLMILNTQGSKPIFISLDNGGLVAGVATYPLGSGSNLNVIFDGTNLNQQS